MPQFAHLTPPTEGSPITRKNGQLVVPDHPVVPYIEGDGTGPDIWRASGRVFDAAVAKAYGGKRRIVWFEVPAGEKAKDTIGEWLPNDTIEAVKAYRIAIKGPLTTPVGGGHPQPERDPAPGARPVRVCPARPLLPGHAGARQAPREDERRHLPRGCPFSCDFCSVAQFFGATYRYRPVDEVIEEVKQLPSGGYFTFVDDNIMGRPAYAKELFHKLAPLKRVWTSQGSLTMAKDSELLQLAAKSGCYALFVGIESLSQDNVAAMNKSINNVARYEEANKKIRDHGIMIVGSFIFGFDHDDDSVFERTVRFCERNKIDLPIFFILTPVPGTRLYNRMDEDGRILHKDWSRYNGSNVVFKPRLISEETLFNGYSWAFQEIYSYTSIAKRILMPPQKRVVPEVVSNLPFRRMVMRAPIGRIPIMSRVLGKLITSIPIKDNKNLAPTFVDATWRRSG